MTEIIKKFIEGMENKEDVVDLALLLEKESDKKVFEKWVQIFNSITPFNIHDGLKT